MGVERVQVTDDGSVREGPPAALLRSRDKLRVHPLMLVPLVVDDPGAVMPGSSHLVDVGAANERMGRVEATFDEWVRVVVRANHARVRLLCDCERLFVPAMLEFKVVGTEEDVFALRMAEAEVPFLRAVSGSWLPVGDDEVASGFPDSIDLPPIPGRADEGDVAAPDGGLEDRNGDPFGVPRSVQNRDDDVDQGITICLQ